MLELKTKTETEKVKKAFVTFIDSQKENIAGFLTTMLKDEGENADTQIKVEENEITIYQLAPDKGFVLVENNVVGELPMKLTKYKTIQEDIKYVTQEKDLIVLYIKKPEGVADIRLGVFKNLNDAVLNINSESVLNTIKMMKEREAAKEKAEAKTAKRLERLGKATAELAAYNAEEAVTVEATK